MIDTPSVTGGEAEIVRFLSSFLEGLQYRVETQEVEKNRANIIASTGVAPRIVFSTHTDTVPPHIRSSEDEDYIYGRGACDAKGIIAAQIFAAEQLRAGGNHDVGLLFVVDEELSSAGARVANNHPRAASVRYLINGEPTGNQRGVGAKGTLRVLLKTEGRAAHSAYPEAGDSAIEKLLDGLADVPAAGR